MTSVVETELEIPLGGGFRAHGVLREQADGPLVVLVPCLSGDATSLCQFMSSRGLEAAGFSTLRLDLYGRRRPWQRSPLDWFVEVMATDLDQVLLHLRRERPERVVSVCGHSLGGLAILLSQTQAFEAAELWDATHGGFVRDAEEWLGGDPYRVWEPTLGLWRARWGRDVLLGESAFSYEAMSAAECDALIDRLHRPVKIVAAGANDSLLGCQRSYYEHANEPKALAVIEGADHGFGRGESMELLIAETTAWLDVYGRGHREMAIEDLVAG